MSLFSNSFSATSCDHLTSFFGLGTSDVITLPLSDVMNHPCKVEKGILLDIGQFVLEAWTGNKSLERVAEFQGNSKGILN